jgi:hypothetical protein
MWIFAGASVVFILYPMIEEWHQRLLDVLALMRRHAALGHHWDAARGRWTDGHPPICLYSSTAVRSFGTRLAFPRFAPMSTSSRTRRPMAFELTVAAALVLSALPLLHYALMI